ncbi:MAG: PglZ domain-containing protein [Thermoplasmata archaeon]|nr:PglZ domain-containing protein [Thermoplasmata archaeon]
MRVESFLELLRRTPVVLKGNELPLLYVDRNTRIIRDIEELNQQIDSPNPINDAEIVIVDDDKGNPWSFPVAEVSEDLMKEDLNSILNKDYDILQERMFSQTDIADRILSDLDYDVIVLILVDGLSYYDCRIVTEAQPCLVNGPTLTRVGMRNIINDPPIVSRLFDSGIRERRGFSHWNRNETLTNQVFEGFTSSQMHKIREFKDIMMRLEKELVKDTYIQIVLEGCDQISHKNRDRPLVSSRIEQLVEEYIVALSNTIKSKNLSAVIHMTSDHGIWWKPELYDEDLQVPQLVHVPHARSRRYVKGYVDGEHILHFSSYGMTYSVLKYPFIFSPYKSNEWGTHGGVSIYESIVPFCTAKVMAE